MKKTLVAILALSGMACAADGDLTLENAVGAFTIANNSITSVVGDVTLNGNSLTLGNGGYWGTTSVEGGVTRTTMTVALTLDMSKLSGIDSAEQLIKMGAWGIGVMPESETSDNVKFTGTWDQNNPFDGLATGAHATSGDYTIVVALTHSGTRIFDGSTSAFYSRTGLKGNVNNTTLTISDTALSAVKKAIVWSDSDYSGGTKIASAFTTINTMPEPATATLSLLALAGLAARRRRH